jgi:hypothetical protein
MGLGPKASPLVILSLLCGKLNPQVGFWWLNCGKGLPPSPTNFPHLCSLGETDSANRSNVLVLLLGIALWKSPLQSSSRFKADPVDLKKFLTLSRYLDESFFDHLQTSPSMSRNPSLVDRQVSLNALLDFNFSEC